MTGPLDGESDSLDLPYSPESLTYDKELFANAVAAYLRNPRWINEQAPATAAYLRSIVNTHPFLSRILGLNSMAPVGLLGAGTAASLPGGAPAIRGALNAARQG